MSDLVTDCAHCAGMRCDCTCETDCGARPGEFHGAYCPKGEGYVDWLRGTGLYSEAELSRLSKP